MEKILLISGWLPLAAALCLAAESTVQLDSLPNSAGGAGSLPSGLVQADPFL